MVIRAHFHLDHVVGLTYLPGLAGIAQPPEIVVAATLWALAQQGEVKPEVVAEAIAHYDIDPERIDPRSYDL